MRLLKWEKYKNMIEDELKLDYDLSLPSDIPQSMIAKDFYNAIDADTDTDTDVIVLKGLYNIFTKYIDSSTATMEVNISSSTKYNLEALFGNNSNYHGQRLKDKGIEINKVFYGMEIAVKEISYLMNDSAARFRRQSVFAEIMQGTAISSHKSRE